MGIKTSFAALCCIQFVLVVAIVNKENISVPTEQLVPVTSQNSTTILKDAQISVEEIDYYEQYDDRFADIFAMETTEQEVEEQAKEDVADKENNDGRSAYINNQFVSDDQLSHVNPAPPLYEVLQQQVQQVLAETLPEYSIEQQDTTNGTVSNYDNLNEDSDENMSTLEREDNDEYVTENSSTYESKPKPIVELPKPLYSHSTTTPTSLLTIEPQTEQTVKPSLQYEEPSGNCQPMAISTIKSSDAAQTYKKRITYKTVSSSSQLVSTPLADLILKFSIGIAQPLRSTYFEDGKVETHNYGNQFRGTNRRNAKSRLREIKSRPLKISFNS